MQNDPVSIPRTRELFKDTLFYGAGIIGSRVFSFLLVPLFAYRLGTIGYGQLEILETITAILFIVSTLCVVPEALMRRYQDVKFSDRKALAFTVLLNILVPSLIILAICWFVAPEISRWIFSTPENAYLIHIVLVRLFVQILSQVPLTLLRLERRSGIYSAVILLTALADLVFCVWFTGFRSMGISGILVAALFSYGIQFLLLSGYFSRRLEFRYLRAISIWLYALPLVLDNLSNWVINLSDRWFIKIFLPSEELGRYALGYKLGMIMYFLVTSFNLAWPTIFLIWKDASDAKRRFAHFFKIYVLLFSLLPLTISTFGPELVKLLSPDSFQGAHKVILPVSLGYLFYGIFNIVVIGFHISERTTSLPIITLFSGLLNMLLNYFLIPRWGISGAAWATTFSFLALCLLTGIKSYKLYPVAWFNKSLCLQLLIVFLFYSTTYSPSLLFRLLSLSSVVLLVAFFLRREIKEVCLELFSRKTL